MNKMSDSNHSKRFEFRIVAHDPAGRARAGKCRTSHGSFQTPAFLPVGSAAAVKLLTPNDLHVAGAQIVLGNTYHLLHHPGVDILRNSGGLANFMAWDGPTLTDSGGFQVFSLAATSVVTKEGVRFRSIYDGRDLMFTPELVWELQRDIGADIIYSLDECSPYPVTEVEARRAMELTLHWERGFMKSLTQNADKDGNRQAAFLPVQGGCYADLRREASDKVAEMDPDGFGIGGVSVGEPRQAMLEVADLCCSLLPPEKPRHLLGVGTPQDILDAVAMGVDLFDCVLPTRNGRNGQAFTSRGEVNLRNARHRGSDEALDEECGCECCRTFTRGYLHHLMASGEMLGMRLLSIHNLTFYEQLMSKTREAIASGDFTGFRHRMLEGMTSGGRPEHNAET